MGVVLYLAAVLLPFHNMNTTEAGCDEAGRGCLAGPVFAAAVILPPGYDNPSLNDSKKLGTSDRARLRKEIERDALAWAVAHCTVDEIDAHNIFQCSYRAMHRAVDRLATRPEFLLIDGKYFVPHPEEIDYLCVIKGDGKYQSIAAAGILAKTHRDEHLAHLHTRYPEYGWLTNKGYPTKAHRAAIRKHGVTAHHRKSFKLFSGGVWLFL